MGKTHKNRTCGFNQMEPWSVSIGYHDIKSMSRCQADYLILHVNFEEISFTLVEPFIVL